MDYFALIASYRICLLYNYITCFYLLHNAENTFFKDRYTSIIYYQKHRHSENLFGRKLTKPRSLNGKTHLYNKKSVTYHGLLSGEQ